MSKVVCVLYPDPVDGYPTSYARDDAAEDRRNIPTVRAFPRRKRSTSSPARCSAASPASSAYASFSKVRVTHSL